MKFSIALEPLEKIARVGIENGFEAAGDAPHAEPTPPSCYTPAATRPTRQERNAASLDRSIYRVMTPRGPKPLLRTMMTTACERNCFYCAFRAGRSSTERLTFQPDELAEGFLRMNKARLVDGLFLSSGIIGGGVRAQDKIIDTAEILRKKKQYDGFIHLKIMPGAEYEQVRRAMQLADRVSVNLEGPTQGRLAKLAPQKEFWDELMQRLLWMHQIRSEERVRSSSVTQFVVGAVGDTDLELVSLSEKLYRQAGLSRVYFSSFFPIPDTPFDNLAPASGERQLPAARLQLGDRGHCLWSRPESPPRRGPTASLGRHPPARLPRGGEPCR